MLAPDEAKRNPIGIRLRKKAILGAMLSRKLCKAIIPCKTTAKA